MRAVAAWSGHLMHFEFAGLSDVGRSREHNEDSLLLAPELGVFAVADGMGGHAAGEVASRIAVETFREFFEANSAEAAGTTTPQQELKGGAEESRSSSDSKNSDAPGNKEQAETGAGSGSESKPGGGSGEKAESEADLSSNLESALESQPESGSKSAPEAEFKSKSASAESDFQSDANGESGSESDTESESESDSESEGEENSDSRSDPQTTSESDSEGRFRTASDLASASKSGHAEEANKGGVAENEDVGAIVSAEDKSIAAWAASPSAESAGEPLGLLDENAETEAGFSDDEETNPAATRRQGLDPLSALTVQAVEQANRNILEAASAEGREGMGTTCVLGLFRQNKLRVAWVGDSRAYVLRQNQLLPATVDHSLANELIQQGRLHPDHAETFQYRNVITRALGADTKVVPDITAIDLEPDDLLLLCSDGLNGMLSDDHIAEILLDSESLSLACKQLIDEANEAGGHDNITVVLVRCR